MLIKLSNIRLQNPEKHPAMHTAVSQVSAIFQLFYTVHKFYVQNLSTISVEPLRCYRHLQRGPVQKD